MANKITILLLIFFISILITLQGKQNAISAVLLDRIVATVNDEVITWSELVNVIKVEGKSFLEDVSDEEAKKRIKELERPFLNNLIEKKLQVQEARKTGLGVSSPEIDDAIAEIRNKYDLSEETFLNSLEAEQMTMEDYRTRLATQIMVQKVVNFAVRTKIVISDKEIEEYYKTNKAKLIGKEQFRIRQIFLAVPDDGHKASVEAKADDLYRRITEGEDFTMLASEFSEDPSREFGGDLGYISRGSALQEVEDMAISLNIGDFSKPFWSSAGLHIIKLEDRIEGGTLQRNKENIKERLVQKAFESKYHEWMAGLREKAYIEIRL